MTGSTSSVVRGLRDAYPTAMIAPKLRDDPPSIDAVERRRSHLWGVAALLMLALSAAVVLLFAGADLSVVLEGAPALRWSFLALSVAFILYVVDQERRLRRLTAALIEERVLTTALQARIADLSTLTKVGRVVNSVLTLEEVLEVILTSAFELTGATTGSVMLRDDDRLVVAASAGDEPAPVGASVHLGTGVAGWVAEREEPLLITGRLAPGEFPGGVRSSRHSGSSVIAPLIAGDELLGVLSVSRSADAEPFAEAQMRSVALFAEHAATAVRNAYVYGEQHRTVEALASSLEKRAEFVATMVHELKTPLTVIVGFSSMLERKWGELDEARRREVLGSIRGQAERLRAMVDEVLRAASVDAGADLRREPVDVGELLTSLVGSITMVAREREDADRDIRLVGADGPLVVAGDREALYRVFENLLENAVKYSPPGAPVDVVVERAGDEVVVRVVDHGPGIAAADLDTVFERFRRTDHSVSGGVGLGLYIVRQLVLSHGGRVWAESDPGAGSTFTVALPVAEAADGHAAAGSVPTAG